jgi:hypothetical protein
MYHRESYLQSVHATAVQGIDRARERDKERKEADGIAWRLAHGQFVPSQVGELHERLKVLRAKDEAERRAAEATAAHRHGPFYPSSVGQIQATMGMDTLREVAEMTAEAAQEATEGLEGLTDSQARLYYKTLSPKKHHKAPAEPLFSDALVPLTVGEQDDDDDDDEDETDGDGTADDRSSLESQENQGRAAALLRMTMAGAAPINTSVPHLMPPDYYTSLQQQALQASQFFQQQQQLMALSQMRLQQHNHQLASQKHQQEPLPRKPLPAAKQAAPAATNEQQLMPPQPRAPPATAPPPPPPPFIPTSSSSASSPRKSPVNQARAPSAFPRASASGGGPSLPTLKASMFASEAASASPVKALQAQYVPQQQPATASTAPVVAALQFPPSLTATGAVVSRPSPAKKPALSPRQAAAPPVAENISDSDEEDSEDDEGDDGAAVPISALVHAAARSSTVMGPLTPSQLKLFSKTVLKAAAGAAASAVLAEIAEDGEKEGEEALLLSSDAAAASLLPAMLAAQKAAAKAARKELRRQQRAKEGGGNDGHSPASSSTSGAERKKKAAEDERDGRRIPPVSDLALDHHAAASFLGTAVAPSKPKSSPADGDKKIGTPGPSGPVLFPLPNFGSAGQQQQQQPRMALIQQSLPLQQQQLGGQSRAPTVLSIPQSPAPFAPAAEPAQPKQQQQPQDGMVLVPMAQAAAGAAALASGLPAPRATAVSAGSLSHVASSNPITSPLQLLSMLGDTSAAAAAGRNAGGGASVAASATAALAGATSSSAWAQRNQMAAVIDAKFKELSLLTTGAGGVGDDDDDL